MTAPGVPTAPTYSRQQLDRYYERIELSVRRVAGDWARKAPGLTYLRALQRNHMAHVPFENLSLHYSTDHQISIDPQALYRKIVERRRGGYCMENSGFFGTVLRSLGYQVYAAGARVAHRAADDRGPEFGGWSHMVNLVTINGAKYMVDVGFGADCPTQPMRLKEGECCTGLGTQSWRLRWTTIPETTDPSQQLWVLEGRRKEEQPWTPYYCFAELEFLPADFSNMNYVTSTRRTSLFTWMVMCTRTIVEGDEAVGVRTLANGDVKERRNGEVRTIMTCENEAQRVEALKEWFGISLTEEEQRGIEGLGTELKGWHRA
ncbi:MAG: hypothetical protein M1823_002833 [Watsoniomyces obsoletus]|nr:MAG: hypothetical protein M1823_002833 [Watsoniomyces obsoletus]